MNLAEVKHLQERIQRIRGTALDRRGSGMQWSYTFPDGGTHAYTVKGLKSPETIADDIAHWCVWVWSMKDRMKEFATSLGREAKVVEAVVDQDRTLQICADLANREKHGKLKRSRTGVFPKLGCVKYTVPQQSIASITVGAFSVETDTKNEHLVEVSLPVLDNHDRELGDAFVILDAAMKRCENLLIEWGHAV